MNPAQLTKTGNFTTYHPRAVLLVRMRFFNSRSQERLIGGYHTKHVKGACVVSDRERTSCRRIRFPNSGIGHGYDCAEFRLEEMAHYPSCEKENQGSRSSTLLECKGVQPSGRDQDRPSISKLLDYD